MKCHVIYFVFYIWFYLLKNTISSNCGIDKRSNKKFHGLVPFAVICVPLFKRVVFTLARLLKYQ